MLRRLRVSKLIAKDIPASGPAADMVKELQDSPYFKSHDVSLYGTGQPDLINFGGLYRAEGSQGASTEIISTMRTLCKSADNHKVRLIGFADSSGPNQVPNIKLVTFYEKFGFKQIDRNEIHEGIRMLREPK